MTPPKRHGFLYKLWQQVANILIAILLAAAIVSAVLNEIAELVFIIAVVVINIIIGLVQEAKAEKAADAIKRMLSPTAVVLRDGQRANVDAADCECPQGGLGA